MEASQSTPYPRVIVTLNSQDGDLSRSFVLSRDRPNIKIGRASKSGEARFKAQPNNGWIESPIMSRDHALLMMGGSSPIPLLLRDTGSTHGTFINDERLVPNRDNVLKTMDKLSFGVPVTSGREIYHPKTYKLILDYERSRELPSPKPRATQEKSTGFHVPLSDSEEEFGDENFQEEIPHREPSVEILSTGRGPIRAPSPDVVIYQTQTAQKLDNVKNNHVDLTMSDPLEPQNPTQHQVDGRDNTRNQEKNTADHNKPHQPQEPNTNAEPLASNQANTLDSRMGLKISTCSAHGSPHGSFAGENSSSTLATVDFIGKPLDTPTKQPGPSKDDVESSPEVEHDEDNVNDDVQSSVYSPSYSPPPPGSLQRPIPLTPEEDASSESAREGSVSSEESVFNDEEISTNNAKKPQDEMQIAGIVDNSVAGEDGGSEKDSLSDSSEIESGMVSEDYDEEDACSVMNQSESSVADETSPRHAETKGLEAEHMHAANFQPHSATMVSSTPYTAYVPLPVPMTNRAPSPSDAALVKTLHAGPPPTSKREQYIPPGTLHSSLCAVNQVANHEPFWAQPSLYSPPPATTTPWFPNYNEYGRDAVETSPMFDYPRMQSHYDPLTSYYTSGPFSQVAGGTMDVPADALRRDTASKLPTKSSKVHISDIVNDPAVPAQSKMTEPQRSYTDDQQHLSLEEEVSSPQAFDTIAAPKSAPMEPRSGPPKRKAAEMEAHDTGKEHSFEQQAVSDTTAEKPALPTVVVSHPQPSVRSPDAFSFQQDKDSHMSTNPPNDTVIITTRGEPARKKLKTAETKPTLSRRPSWIPPWKRIVKRDAAVKENAKGNAAIWTFVGGCFMGAVGVFGAAATIIWTTPLSVQEEVLRSI